MENCSKRIPYSTGLKFGHAPANFAFAGDTKRKTAVPLFFASTRGLRLPSF